MTRYEIRNAIRTGADLSYADLSGAYLSNVDLRGAKGLPPAPIVPNIDAAILAEIEAGGVLDMSAWHCGTRHCRAGWAVVLAGPEGLALESRLGTNVAAALIYTASRPGQRVPDWYASNDEAMADIRLHAGAAHASASGLVRP